MSCGTLACLRGSNGLSMVRKLRREVLLVQSLLAELVELDLAGKVSSDQLLDLLGDGRLEVVLVDLLEQVHLVEVDGGRPGEELGHVLFENGEGRVEIFQDSDYGVLAFNGVLGAFQRSGAVEGSGRTFITKYLAIEIPPILLTSTDRRDRRRTASVGDGPRFPRGWLPGRRYIPGRPGARKSQSPSSASEDRAGVDRGRLASARQSTTAHGRSSTS